MSAQEIHAVTGAYGYSGQYITRRLLNKGHKVITLTNSLNRYNPYGDQVKAYSFNFHNPKQLTENLKGVRVLYNSYWVRFNHKEFSFKQAVENSYRLFEAAYSAGVEKVVHVSITNPSESSPYEYFSGKALLERGIKETGLAYSILRPALLFGEEDILINNIAWTLRQFPVVFVFGDGTYRLQPIYVDDLAKLAVEQGENPQNISIEAIGPETFTYRELIDKIGQIIGCIRPVLPAPPFLGYLAAKVIGTIVDDVIITREEIGGLMDDLLYVESPPAGETRLTHWLRDHSETVGRKYTSEMGRRLNREEGYHSNKRSSYNGDSIAADTNLSFHTPS